MTRGWTVGTLKEHYDELRRIDEGRRRESLVFVVLFVVALWGELQRRLHALNHAHEQAVEVQHTYVTRDIFDAAIARQDEQQTVTTSAVADNTSRRLGGQASFSKFVALATMAALLVAGVVAVLTLTHGSAAPQCFNAAHLLITCP